MSGNTINLIQQKKTKTDGNELLKLLIFNIGILNLALSVNQVQKVIKHTPVYGSGLSHVNLAHLGKQEITVIDLHRKFFKVTQPEILEKKGYFIITKSDTDEPLGIMVTQAPSLIDVPLKNIRIIPNSYRSADTLEIASHVAVIPQSEDKSLTIFILDLKRLI